MKNQLHLLLVYDNFCNLYFNGESHVNPIHIRPRRGFGKNFVTTIIAMLAGNAVIYLFGVSWLANFIGIENAVKHGILPFLYGDALKIFVATAIVPVAWKFLSHTR